MSSNWKYLLILLEILPWILTFSISINFAFLSPSSSPTAGALLVRIIPTLLSALASFIFLLYHHHKYSHNSPRLFSYNLNPDDRIFLDFERSMLAGLGLFVLFSRVVWMQLDELVENLFGDLGEANTEGRIVGSLAVLILVVVWGVVSLLILWMPWVDLKRFLMFLRSKDEDLESGEREERLMESGLRDDEAEVGEVNCGVRGYVEGGEEDGMEYDEKDNL
ncbi:hypothetical protein L207DRAFT_512288 [Hyaloscypha variabilis F]|uniref:Uncharacterized protein n=1 Tax=Hyaloscypha variabilis (strain UAMH 11265 / GT02V1 / F) TaxID=1149755 RepID=A0A2J6RQP4_HYAVF|nr:hypothetical protein L207DRAFT_512288 [Hyaloscypha variabilis F]